MTLDGVLERARESVPRTHAQWLGLAVLTAALVFYMAPIYVMLISGLKSATDVSLIRMWALPETWSAGGFGEAWERLSPNMMNSVFMVVPATILASIIGAMNGYLFSKWRFRGSEVLFTLLIFGMFIPYQTILIPLVTVLQTIGLYGKLPGLVLVHVVYGLPITTLIFRNYFTSLPNELVEAARVDGAGVMGIFRHVILPLSPPAFVVVGMWQFTNVWNDFLFGVIVVPNPRAQPVTIALNNLSGSFAVDWNVVMAGALIAGLPTAIVYVLLGRYFIRGVYAGSVKG